MTLHARVLRACENHGTRTAIEHHAGALTYADIPGLARRSAAHVSATTSREAVGLVVSRHPDTYLLYLAVLMAGKVVVPVSDELPPERVGSILSRVGADVLLRPSRASSWNPVLEHQVVEGVDPHRLPEQTGRVGQSREVAYVLHTSGSTGEPKGVPVTHQAVLAYLDHVVPRYEIGPSSRLSANFSLTFDLAVFDFFAALTTGATLVLPQGREHLLPARYVQRGELTHWFSVPSVIRSASALGALRPGSMPTLRWSLFCGEPLRLDQARRWLSCAPGSVIENVYGPTELTLSCSQYRLPADPDAWPVTSNGTVPIGTVYPHLDWRLHGEQSELQVRGDQRFDGYVNPSQNPKAFCDDVGAALGSGPDPVPRHYWYRTGDRVLVEGGQLVHHGRTDRQVKVRGHRIELAEVETVLRSVRGVDDVAVVVVDSGSLPELAAAVVGDVDPEELRSSASQRLATYMVPQRILQLEALPLNANGKVDARAVTALASDETVRR